MDSTSVKVYRAEVKKFHENFNTSESYENFCKEVLSHAEHESGLSFLITIISNPMHMFEAFWKRSCTHPFRER